ncbi:glycosyltransferase family 4 protein [Novosphingobium sp. BL-8H]|uniref:glycosyltransferase family 4 protein n=1 Tax=Novosphingobium sp. BL-8H TaxID=3127640 RepID=UPI0037567C73
MTDIAGPSDAALNWGATSVLSRRQSGETERAKRPSHAPTAQIGQATAARLRVAYLTNVYPKVSHSFIRTEIAALERQGLSVSRFTVRRSDQPLPGAQDREEAARTVALLDNAVALAGAAAACFATRPLAAWHALRLSWRVCGPGNRHRAAAYFAEAALLARRLERVGIRHLHVHFGTNPATVARLVARLAPVTYSFTVHGPDEFDAPQALDLPGKIADAAFVAGVSSFGRGQLMRWSDPAHWGRIHVVHCAPDASFLADGAVGPAAAKATRFLCVARLSAQKGLPLLIEAMGRIAAQRVITLDVIGDGEDRAAIENQIERLGLKHNVRLRGWAGPEEIRQALTEADVFVLASFAEGLPVVLMEAMALRCPVIATAIAGIPELVDDNVGWLVPSGSVEAIVAALEAACDAPAESRAAMGARARLRVLERHDPDRNAADLAALLTPYC